MMESTTWKISPVTSSEVIEIEKCNETNCSLQISIERIKQLLNEMASHNDPYSVFTNQCHAVKDDHFSENEKCIIAKYIHTVALGIFKKAPPSNYYDANSSVVLMSAFVRKNTSENQSDLAGDEGKLAYQLLSSNNLLNVFQCVIDIGGQDSKFVEKFENAAKKIVADINLLTPFLGAYRKKPHIEYAIGNISALLKTNLLTSTDQLGRKLIAMSNFINVLSPEHGWKIIKKIAQRINSEDILVITNLLKDQFYDDGNFRRDFYSLGDTCNGIHQIKKNNLPYKSTIVQEEFLLSIKQLNLESIKTEKRQLICSFTKTNGELGTATVSFVTILLKKNVSVS